MSQWNHNLDQEYSDSQFSQSQSQSSYGRVPYQHSYTNEYSAHSPNQNHLYASGMQNGVQGSPYSTQQPQLHPVDTHNNYNQLPLSQNAGASTSFTNNPNSSFMTSPSIQQQPNAYGSAPPPTYNFPQMKTYDQSPPSSGVFNFTAPPSTSPQGMASGSQTQAYYPPASTGMGVGSASNPRAKRFRAADQPDDGAEDEADNGGRPEQRDSQKGKPHACARCKSLKVRCEFKTDNDPCKRCLNGGHECVIPGRKKRRTPPKREHLIAEIAKQAETIDKLMAQLAAAEEAQKQRFVRSTTSDSFSGTSSPPMLSPSSADANSSYFGDHSSPNPETNKAVEDWIVKARESLAVFGDIIGMGGASIPKSMIMEDDPEDSSSGDDDDFSPESFFFGFGLSIRLPVLEEDPL